MLAVYFTVKAMYITNKIDCFSFNSGHAVRVAELIKEDWPIVLQ